MSLLSTSLTKFGKSSKTNVAQKRWRMKAALSFFLLISIILTTGDKTLSGMKCNVWRMMSSPDCSIMTHPALSSTPVCDHWWSAANHSSAWWPADQSESGGPGVKIVTPWGHASLASQTPPPLCCCLHQERNYSRPKSNERKFRHLNLNLNLFSWFSLFSVFITPCFISMNSEK